MPLVLILISLTKLIVINFIYSVSQPEQKIYKIFFEESFLWTVDTGLTSRVSENMIQ